jgi:biopolymer transport protein ExbD
MAMSVGQGGEGEPMIEMNTTPLIDVMLVLIVMLIITLPIQTHAVKLDMPKDQNKPPPETPPEVIDLLVDFDGTISWNGGVIDVPTMDHYLKDIGKMPLESQAEIHLKPHRIVSYGYVARVLAHAQREGVKKIGIVGNEQFMTQ